MFEMQLFAHLPRKYIHLPQAVRTVEISSWEMGVSGRELMGGSPMFSFPVNPVSPLNTFDIPITTMTADYF